MTRPGKLCRAKLEISALAASSTQIGNEEAIGLELSLR
jgi:hypothetical protein